MTFPPPLPGPQTPGEGLPEIVPPQRSGHLPARREQGEPVYAFMGDLVRTGRWEAARRTTVYGGLGNVKLDLRDVIVPGETLEVTVWLALGDVRVLVPPGTTVEVHGMTVLGDGRTETDVQDQGAAPTGARVVLNANTFLGNVRVRSMAPGVARPPRGWRWARPRP